MRKFLPVKRARLTLYILINFRFNSHPQIDSVVQRQLYHLRLLENAIAALSKSRFGQLLELREKSIVNLALEEV